MSRHVPGTWPAIVIVIAIVIGLFDSDHDSDLL